MAAESARTVAEAEFQRALVRANGPLNYAEHREAMREATKAYEHLRAVSSTPASEIVPAPDRARGEG